MKSRMERPVWFDGRKAVVAAIFTVLLAMPSVTFAQPTQVAALPLDRLVNMAREIRDHCEMLAQKMPPQDGVYNVLFQMQCTPVGGSYVCKLTPNYIQHFNYAFSMAFRQDWFLTLATAQQQQQIRESYARFVADMTRTQGPALQFLAEGQRAKYSQLVELLVLHQNVSYQVRRALLERGDNRPLHKVRVVILPGLFSDQEGAAPQTQPANLIPQIATAPTAPVPPAGGPPTLPGAPGTPGGNPGMAPLPGVNLLGQGSGAVAPVPLPGTVPPPGAPGSIPTLPGVPPGAPVTTLPGSVPGLPGAPATLPGVVPGAPAGPSTTGFPAGGQPFPQGFPQGGGISIRQNANGTVTISIPMDPRMLSALSQQMSQVARTQGAGQVPGYYGTGGLIDQSRRAQGFVPQAVPLNPQTGR